MTHQKHKHRIYQKFIALYPKPYRRQYRTQMLQLADDMLAEATSKSSKIWIRLKLARDVIQSLPKEWVLHHQRQFLRSPKRFVAKQLGFVVLLLIPFIGSMAASMLLPFANYDSGWRSIWYGSACTTLWLQVLPAIATVISAYTVAIWLIVRHNFAGRYKTRRASTVIISVLMVLTLAGVSLSGYISAMQLSSKRMMTSMSEAAVEANRREPRLACTLLPLDQAKRVLGSNARLFSSPTHTMTYKDYPGGSYEDIYFGPGNVESSHCFYADGSNTTRGLTAGVERPLTEEAIGELYASFTHPDNHSGEPITLGGYEGYLAVDPEPGNGANLSLWVDDHRLTAMAPSFEAAHYAIKQMIANLHRTKAAD